MSLGAVLTSPVVLAALLVSAATLVAWRSPRVRAAVELTRVVLLLAIALQLPGEIGVSVGGAWRQAMLADEAHAYLPPAYASASEFDQGVTSMRELATEALKYTHPSIVALMMLGVAPAVRLLRKPVESPQDSRATT